MHLIDIVGIAGSGKSTVGRHLNWQLAAATLAPGEEPSVGTAEAEKITHLERLCHTLRRPSLVILAARLSGIRSTAWSLRKAFFSHLASLLRRSILLERAARANQPYLVIPQGLIAQLRPSPAEAIAILPQRLRPSVVLELCAPAHECLARKILREKPVRKPILGKHSVHGEVLYAELRHGFTHEQAFLLLEKWNERFCVPKLHKHALQEISRSVEEQIAGAESTSDSTGERPRRLAVSKHTVTGVTWIRIDNSEGVAPSKAARQARELVLSLGTEDSSS